MVKLIFDADFKSAFRIFILFRKSWKKSIFSWKSAKIRWKNVTFFNPSEFWEKFFRNFFSFIWYYQRNGLNTLRACSGDSPCILREPNVLSIVVDSDFILNSIFLSDEPSFIQSLLSNNMSSEKSIINLHSPRQDMNWNYEPDFGSTSRISAVDPVILFLDFFGSVIRFCPANQNLVHLANFQFFNVFKFHF